MRLAIAARTLNRPDLAESATRGPASISTTRALWVSMLRKSGGSVSLVLAKAQSSHTVKASTSFVSTVAPPSMEMMGKLSLVHFYNMEWELVLRGARVTGAIAHAIDAEGRRRRVVADTGASIIVIANALRLLRAD